MHLTMNLLTNKCGSLFLFIAVLCSSTVCPGTATALTPEFTDRMSGLWVSSLCDDKGIPMVALRIDIDEENDKHEATLLPDCPLYHSPLLKECLDYITRTSCVLYSPSNGETHISFRHIPSPGGNTDKSQIFIKSDEEGVYKNSLTLRTYELCPDVVAAELFYYVYTDGDPLPEDYYRSFFLYKVSPEELADLTSGKLHAFDAVRHRIDRLSEQEGNRPLKYTDSSGTKHTVEWNQILPKQ